MGDKNTFYIFRIATISMVGDNQIKMMIIYQVLNLPMLLLYRIKKFEYLTQQLYN